MNVVVVGAGAQGAPCAAILARHPSVERVLLGSTTPAAAEAIRDRIGSPKVVAARLDAADPDGLAASARNAVGRPATVIDMTPSFRSVGVMRAALALGSHYLNTAACPEHLDQFIHRRPLELDADFRAAGRTALLSCGVSPGVANILCRRHTDDLDAVERIEIRAGFLSPSQNEVIKTWVPSWCPEQQYFDYCDPPCLFHDGKHEHMPPFHEPEEYDFGGPLGKVTLTHHAHDEQYTLPLLIGKGIRYCCYKYPFEPAVATFFATGFTHDKTVEVNGTTVRPVDVLMKLLPRPVQIATLDREVQAQLVPLIAATRAHIKIVGAKGGRAVTRTLDTGAYFDQAATALELFGTANVAVPYAAAAGAVMLAEGKTKAGVVWPEELDATRYLAVADTLGLNLTVTVR
jgi:saccharopine dehydrogenase-like NADP-dependent oxidoreductase